MRDPFLIEPSRPIAYLTPDHVGFGASQVGQLRQRVWLKFQNNCRVPIDVHASGPPVDAPDDRFTLMYQLVIPSRAGVWVSQDERSPERTSLKVPPGTMSEVGSVITVAPGQAILFSAPASDFSPNWDMHIPFSLHLPLGKGLRDESVWGGEPVLFLSYAFYDLPQSFRIVLKDRTSK